MKSVTACMFAPVAVLGLCLAQLGCSSPVATIDDGGMKNSGVDAGVLDAGILDAGDGGPDGGGDAGPDAGGDAGGSGPYFGTPVVTVAAPFITQLATADFNGDGKLDLVAAEGAARDDAGNVLSVGVAVQVLMGNGDGTFGPPTELLTLASPAGVVALDIDGDGLPDIAVGVCGAGHNRLSYFLNRGDAGFGPRQDVPVAACPYALAVVEGLSENGGPGLATAGPGPDWLDAGSGEVDTFVGIDGGLQLTQRLLTDAVATGVTSFDLNADGHADLAATTSSGLGSGNSEALVWLGQQAGGWQAVLPGNSLDYGPYRALRAGDVDGNASANLLLISSNTSTVALLPGKGDGTFGSAEYRGVSDTPYDLVLGDFQSSGLLDVAVSTRGFPFVGLQVFPSGGQGSAMLGTQMPVLSDGPSFGIAVGDFNGDGLADIALSLWVIGAVTVIPSLHQPPFLPDPATFHPAPHIPIPLVDYNGGPVIASPQVVTITFLDDVNTQTYQQFDDWIVGSDWLAAIGADYGVSNGTNLNVVIQQNAPAAVTDSDIQTMLYELMVDGGIPPPSAKHGEIVARQIYMVYFPYGTTITGPGGGESCQTFHGYHNEDDFTVTPFAFGVVANCDHDIPHVETIASHELAESATDPLLYTAPGYTDLLMNGFPINGWIAEIGDICSQFRLPYEQDGGAVYTVQRIWSNSAADAGAQPCIPTADVPYANVSLAATLPIDCGVTDPSFCTSVYWASAGQTFGITLTGWTDRPSVAAGVAVLPGLLAGSFAAFSPKTTLSAYNLHSGEQAQLTVTVPSGIPSQTLGAFTILSGFDNGNYGYWPILVYVP